MESISFSEPGARGPYYHNTQAGDNLWGQKSWKGLSHEIDFKNFDKNLQNLT